jgi:hypothetical protein
MEDEVSNLVLMPGLDGTGLLFERFVSALRPEIRIHIIEYPEGKAPLEEYAAVVAGGLPAGRVVLLAESFSGIIALYLDERVEIPSRRMGYCLLSASRHQGVSNPLETPVRSWSPTPTWPHDPGSGREGP